MAYKRLKSGKNVSSEKAAELSLCTKEQLFEAVRGQFVETMKLPPEYAGISEEININGYLILRMGHDLNEYYEAVSGKDSFDCKMTEIGLILKAIYEKAEPIIRKRDITFLSRFPAENIFVNIDREKFCYAVLDILLNAAENTAPGGRIRMSVQTTKKFVKVIIGDNGCGMDEETLARCAEPFFTASAGRRKKTGLGLTLAHHFLAESGGRMNIKSEKGKGTTAEMLLPIMAAGSKELSASATVPDILGGKLSPVYIMLSGLGK
ncbi:MAG: HAMP domain-containing histidine kinase [Oscillospiraceae bacterium]|nr:HAMP domain-containing histidine kinase [Oscillospiraceae bacterium]